MLHFEKSHGRTVCAKTMIPHGVIEGWPSGSTMIVSLVPTMAFAWKNLLSLPWATKEKLSCCREIKFLKGKADFAWSCRSCRAEAQVFLAVASAAVLAVVKTTRLKGVFQSLLKSDNISLRFPFCRDFFIKVNWLLNARCLYSLKMKEHGARQISLAKSPAVDQWEESMTYITKLLILTYTDNYTTFVIKYWLIYSIIST